MSQASDPKNLQAKRYLFSRKLFQTTYQKQRCNFSPQNGGNQSPLPFLPSKDI